MTAIQHQDGHAPAKQVIHGFGCGANGRAIDLPAQGGIPMDQLTAKQEHAANEFFEEPLRPTITTPSVDFLGDPFLTAEILRSRFAPELPMKELIGVDVVEQRVGVADPAEESIPGIDGGQIQQETGAFLQLGWAFLAGAVFLTPEGIESDGSKNEGEILVVARQDLGSIRPGEAAIDAEVDAVGVTTSRPVDFIQRLPGVAEFGKGGGGWHESIVAAMAWLRSGIAARVVPGQPEAQHFRAIGPDVIDVRLDQRRPDRS